MAAEIIEVRLRPDGAVFLEWKLDRIVEEVRQRLDKEEEHRVQMLTARGERADDAPHYQKVQIWQPQKRTVRVYKVRCYAANKRMTWQIRVLLGIALLGVALALLGVALVAWMAGR